VPFFDQRAVVERLDRMPSLENADERDRLSGMFLTILSACVLQTRYAL
jgi:hypothetical protein